MDEKILDEMFEMRKKNPRNYDWLYGWLKETLHRVRQDERENVIKSLEDISEFLTEDSFSRIKLHFLQNLT